MVLEEKKRDLSSSALSQLVIVKKWEPTAPDKKFKGAAEDRSLVDSKRIYRCLKQLETIFQFTHTYTAFWFKKAYFNTLFLSYVADSFYILVETFGLSWVVVELSACIGGARVADSINAPAITKICFIFMTINFK